MARKNISDRQVCEAVDLFCSRTTWKTIVHILYDMTQEHPKVCWRAMERAERRGLIDCGSSLNVAFLTDEGRRLLDTPTK